LQLVRKKRAKLLNLQEKDYSGREGILRKTKREMKTSALGKKMLVPQLYNVNMCLTLGVVALVLVNHKLV
jgi:hypothetical protein